MKTVLLKNPSAEQGEWKFVVPSDLLQLRSPAEAPGKIYGKRIDFTVFPTPRVDLCRRRHDIYLSPPSIAFIVLPLAAASVRPLGSFQCNRVMATRAQSRLYNNHNAIQATLLPLFESYSAEPGFVKLDAALGSLRKLPGGLKVLQEHSVGKQENLMFCL